jgi:beta-lactamase regulating signal transducer with metallopeptidase domain
MIVLSEIFYWILNMSIIGSGTGLIIALIRKIPKIPRFAAYVLWLLPLIRFWVPFGIENRWSLLNLLSKYTTKTVTVWELSPQLPSSTTTNFIQSVESYFPIVYKTNMLKGIFDVASIIWILITLVAIFTLGFLYIASKENLQNICHFEGNIWFSTKTTTPAVYGIVKPKIVIPDWIPQHELTYILAHEQVHIHRMDNLWRCVALITVCIHWFNPLCWLFLQWFLMDMELACDAKVLKTMDTRFAKEYASSLLLCASKRHYLASPFGGAKTKNRIEHILSYKKLTVLSTLIFSLLILTISFILITNAVGG